MKSSDCYDDTEGERRAKEVARRLLSTPKSARAKPSPSQSSKPPSKDAVPAHPDRDAQS